MTVTKLLAIIILLTIPKHVLGQEITSIHMPNRVYWDLGIGLSDATYRDFATSPLFYNGTTLVLQVYRDEISPKKETRFGTAFTGGLLTSESQGRAINSSFSSSFFIDVHQLFRLSKFSNTKWNTKIGTKINTAINFRNNPVLQNNSFGFEIISTLFGSLKVSRDISRQKRKKGSFSFIDYSLPPRARKISYQLNIGILNSTYRNGYIYSNQSSVVNEFDPFYDYEFKIFSGYRLGSSLEYTQFLKNRNAIRFGYTWDVLRTGGDLDVFEMSNHFFTFSLLFNSR